MDSIDYQEIIKQIPATRTTNTNKYNQLTAADSKRKGGQMKRKSDYLDKQLCEK